MSQFFKAAIGCVVSAFLFGCHSSKTVKHLESASIRQQLAQKLILDFRYYCPEAKANGQTCKAPMRSLPKEIAELISKTDLGGVILFSDNLDNVEQIVKLNHDLQQTSQSSKLQLPLFIAIDQEGGRVARLPRQSSTAFTGSMSIAATYKRNGVKFAEQTGRILGQELSATGFNLNFAPSADVNVNPKNPVINIRSFGSNPKIVSELAVAQLNAMQTQGVIGTLKHFPGHGDTAVDSHTGLPIVSHSIEQIEAVDIAPFQYAIKQGGVKAIMTAHIQYPALDSSTVINKVGKTMIKPATMSYKILTDLLRGELGYQGLIITDALDMRGISDFFTPIDAVIETFNAGADIALMPISIRNKQELQKLTKLLDALEAAVSDGKIDKETLSSSFNRIVLAKSELRRGQAIALENKINQAKRTLASEDAKAIEAHLSQQSITSIKGTGQLDTNTKSLFVLMPDENKCLAMTNAMQIEMPSVFVHCMHYLNFEQKRAEELIKQTDATLIASLSPNQSVAEMGGVEDWPTLVMKMKKARIKAHNKESIFKAMFNTAKGHGKQRVFVSLRMPYEAVAFEEYAEHILTTYSYNQHKNDSGSVTGVTYNTLSKVLAGKVVAVGSLPVKLSVATHI